MTDDLRPATAAEIEEALAFALRYRGRKRVGDAAPIMAEIVAERLVGASRAQRVRCHAETAD